MGAHGVAIPIAVALAGMACGDAASLDLHDVPAAVVGDLTIEHAFAPEPVTPDVGSLYLTVHNHGDESDRLLSVSVDVANDVSLHDQDRSGNRVEMVPVPSIVVPERGSVSLEPGGLHAMLQDLERHYREGDSLRVTVEFARAGIASFSAPVVSYVEVADRMAHQHRRGRR